MTTPISSTSTPISSPISGQKRERGEWNSTPEVTQAMRALSKTLRGSSGVMKPTAEGSSGFTFSVQASKRALFSNESASHLDEKDKGIFGDEPVKMIMKFVPSQTVSNEVLSNEIAALFGLKVPQMKRVPPSVSALFASPVRRQKPAFTPSGFDLIVMEQLEGNNLIGLTRSGDTARLHPQSLRFLVKKCARASVYDLFVGNGDRFLRVLEGGSRYNLRSDAVGNGGNILLHLTPQKTRIADVFCIDNAPIGLNSPRVASVGSGLGFSGLGFGEGSSSQTSQVASQNTFSQGVSPVRENKGEKLHQFFVESIQNPKKILDHMRECLLNAIEDAMGPVELTDDLFQARQQIRESIRDAEDEARAGFEQGMLCLHSEEFQEGVRDLLQNKPGSELLNSLVTRNLEWIEQHRS